MPQDGVNFSSSQPENARPQAEPAAVNIEKAKRPEPQEPLPTDRVSVPKQLEYLAAYAGASDKGQRSVSNETIADVVKMKASTVSLANSFFLKMGFLSRTGREYIPSKEVLEYKLAIDWNDADAAHKLAPLIERSWFAQTLRPKLEMRSVEETEAIADLAQRAMADKHYQPQIRALLDYMEKTGIIRREGSLIFLNRRGQTNTQEATIAPPSKPIPREEADFDDAALAQKGAIHLAVTINVDLEQIARWRPDRITAFFGGLAQVLAAQKGDTKAE